jgi:SAM-dependent methyltransferase
LGFFRQQLGADWQLEGASTSLSLFQVAEDSAFPVHPGRVEELELPEGAFDAVLAIDVLEQEDNPLTTLRAIKRLLRAGGKVLIATPNTNSTAFRVFGGRHWSEYDFPRRRNLFRADVLTRSAALAGLNVTSMKTIAAPASWLFSMQTLLADWGAPRWAQAGLERAKGAALTAFGVVEWMQQRRDKGGALVATLERP